MVQTHEIGDCKRFFGYGKRIPKDVKRHCGMCRQHGFVVETRGHTCPYKDCSCTKCKLVRQRRSIMSTQIRLRREQDKKFQRTTDATEADIVPWGTEEKNGKDEANMCYFCQKCKNHGILMWKKDHKKTCEFANCHCVQCDLIDTRRALDRHINSNRSRKTKESWTVASETCSSSDASSTTRSSPSELNEQSPQTEVSPPLMPLLLPMMPMSPFSFNSQFNLLSQFPMKTTPPFSALSMKPFSPFNFVSPFSPFGSLDFQTLMYMAQTQSQMKNFLS